jgi:hypothetical protein
MAQPFQQRVYVKSITWSVPSATRPGVVHTVSESPVDGVLSCTCEARKQCWHQKAVIARLRIKMRVRVQVRPAKPQPVALRVAEVGTFGFQTPDAA